MLNNINLNNLKIFKTVAENNSLVEASAILHITQPAISKSIKKIECELNIKLFNRVKGRLILNTNGRRLLDVLNKTTPFIERTIEEIRNRNDLCNGEIIIGVQEHILKYYLFEKITKFKSKYPNIRFKFIDASTNDLLNKLEKREIDFIIDCSPINNNYEDIKSVKIAYLDMCLITHKNNKRITNILDLKNEPFILPLPRSSIRKNFNILLSTYNIVPNLSLEFDTNDMIIYSVAQNLGIGYVIKKSTFDYKDKVNIIDLNVEIPKLEINYLYLRNEKNKLVELFLKESEILDKL